MKRKIAAILAADVVGYSRLIAEDEEEAIRRLAAYRGVFDDFIANHGGRIFNTAGDAVLAEFGSSVEAVRCAVEVQESLRARNGAFPPSRQMVFRIGITIADVVERDGDLLGDGVNIASRLEGLAEPGGICVSRAVYEQVANKLSVGFTDIGAQSVKNIPDPVHAFIIGSPDAVAAAAARRRGASGGQKRSSVAMPAFVLTAIAAIAASGALAWVVLHPPGPTGTPPAQTVATVPASPGTPVATTTSPGAPPPAEPATEAKDIKAQVGPASVTSPAATSSPVKSATPSTSPPPAADAPAPTADTPSPSEPRTSTSEVAAAGLVRNPAIEKPFDIRTLPIVPLDLHASVRSALAAATGHKALAVASNGRFAVGSSAASVEEAARQAMDVCSRNGTCRVVAVDDVYIVPIPRTVILRGLFDPMTTDQVPTSERPELARRLASASGWSAVAIGKGGKPGIADGAANEADAIKIALNDCGARDSTCRVIALGPFRVERY